MCIIQFIFLLQHEPILKRQQKSLYYAINIWIQSYKNQISNQFEHGR